MIAPFSPSAIKAAWVAYRPAPESSVLRKLRFQTMRWNSVAAITIACVDLLVKLHPVMVLFAAAITVQAVAVTIRYWRTKNRIDTEFQADLAEAPEARASTGGQGGLA